MCFQEFEIRVLMRFLMFGCLHKVYSSSLNFFYFEKERQAFSKNQLSYSLLLQLLLIAVGKKDFCGFLVFWMQNHLETIDSSEMCLGISELHNKYS